MAHNKLDEALGTLIRFGGKENKDVDKNQLQTFIENVRRKQLELQHGKNVFSPIALCRTPKLRKWSAALGVNW